jgi:hypothetical protein
MLLLDKSGSMNEAIDPSSSACNNCQPGSCPASCPTRISVLRQTMQSFLPTNGNVARFGVTIFPADNQCTPSGASQVLTHIMPASDSDTDLQAWASTVNTAVQGVTAGGGTPTNQSLEFVGGLPDLNDPLRDDFVLLLTDGIPNCNINNPNNCTNAAMCTCTISPCPTMPAANDSNFCTRGCLDQDGTVQAIRDLRQRDIRTIVIGFGSDFASAAALSTLNAMATAGGFARACPNGTDAECGSTAMNPNPCLPSKVCQNAFYAAANGADLAAALNSISAVIGADSICSYTLEAQPSSSDLLSVLINGTATPSGPDTWTLMAGKIIFQGMLCDTLKASTTQNPVKVEVRIVQSL